jgi:dolichol-phosphate mannosyltransferase
MANTIFLSIIMPLFNEEASIKAVLAEHVKMVKSISDLLQDWEILCLDDGSTDHTLSILNEMKQEYPKLRIIKNETNQGINFSFMRLHREARGTHIYHTAGDGQWPAKNCEVLLQTLLKENADVVLGVRENLKKIYSPWRRALSAGFNLIPLIFYRLKTTDANGIKLGSRSFFSIEVRSKSFFAEIERLIEAKRLGFKVSSANVEFLTRSGGTAKGARAQNIITSLWDAFRYILTHNPFAPIK